MDFSKLLDRIEQVKTPLQLIAFLGILIVVITIEGKNDLRSIIGIIGIVLLGVSLIPTVKKKIEEYPQTLPIGKHKDNIDIALPMEYKDIFNNALLSINFPSITDVNSSLPNLSRTFSWTEGDSKKVGFVFLPARYFNNTEGWIKHLWIAQILDIIEDSKGRPTHLLICTDSNLLCDGTYFEIENKKAIWSTLKQNPITIYVFSNSFLHYFRDATTSLEKKKAILSSILP